MSDNPQKKKEEKKNTDLWKQKQEEKKRQKEAQEKEAQATEAADKKESKKEKASKAKKEEKKEEKEQVQEKVAPVVEPKTEEAIISYRKLCKIEDSLSEKERAYSRTYQQELIFKEMEAFLSKKDVVLYVGSKSWYPSCQQVYVPNFNSCSQAELVCHYPDISYFLEGTVTKIFCQADFIFSNGSILAKKGALNIVLMGQYLNIPVVGCGGSWNFNGWSPLSEDALREKYGENILEQYDWIEAKHLKSTIMEVGGVNPKQVSIYPPIVYKSINLSAIEW